MAEETKLEHNFKSRKAWQDALMAAPKQSWIKSRSLGRGRKSYYIPIEVKESLKDIFFDEFDVIDIKEKVIVNEILIIVKIQFLPSYPNSEHRFTSGIAAKPIQCSSGSEAFKFPRGKITNALEYNASAAETAAISNALNKLGNVFGKNLNRDVDDGYNFANKVNKSDKKKKKKKKK